MVATAGVGLLISALIIRQWHKKKAEDKEPEAIKAVVLADESHPVRLAN